MKIETIINRWLFPILFLSVLIISVVKVIYFTNGFYDRQLEEEISNYKGYVEGFVYKSSKCNKHQLIFVCKEDLLDRQKMMLYTYDLKQSTINILESGAYIRIKISDEEIMLPDKATNFGEFDRKNYFASNGIFYTFKPGEERIEILDKKINVNIIASNIRNSIENSLDNILGEESSALVMGILTGDTTGISSENKDTYRNAGISHIMAVSGMHVGFIQKLSLLLLSNKRFNFSSRNAICIIVLIAYGAIADFSPSVTRAVLQNGYLLAGKVFKRPAFPRNALAFAFTFQLLTNPYLLLNSGFILSYAAACSIMFLVPLLSDRIFFFGRIPKNLVTGICVNLALFPLLVNYFNSFAPIGIIATLFAGKIAELICISGLSIWVCGFLPFGNLVAKIPGAVAAVLTEGLSIISKTGSGIPPPLGAFTLPSLKVSFVLTYYVLLIILLHKGFAKFLRKNYVLALVGLTVAVVAQAAAFRKTEAVFFDVGQGLSVLYRCDEIVGLIDTGEEKADVSTLLLRQGVGTVDFLVLTHGHEDHTGGFENVLKEHKVKLLIVPGNPYDEAINSACEIAEEYEIEIIRVFDEKNIKLGRTEFCFLLNNEAVSGADEANINNASLVMIAKNSDGKAVFTGDIEAESETVFTEKGFLSDAELLQVPHHGSDTSSCEKNISIISPEYAIISVGEKNNYGHPSKRVIETLEDAGAKVLRTDTAGAVRITLRGEKIKVWLKLKI